MDRGEGALRCDLYMLLTKLRQHGGSIVAMTACSTSELAIARVEHRIYVDKDDFGYVYRPPQPKEGS